MTTLSSLEVDVSKKGRTEINHEDDGNSTASDCFEETNPDSNLKKRKLTHKKSKASKKVRRSQSDCVDEIAALVPVDKPVVQKTSIIVQDTHCWLCHKPENIVRCHFCPRVYHQECLLSFFAQNQFDQNDWVCPECITVMMSECTSNINAKWKTITQNEFNEMLSFVLLRMFNINGSSQFQTAVDNQTIRDYYIIIKHPVHLNLLKSNVGKSKYHSVHAFFSDFKWILHNCTIYNGGASILTNYARNLEKLCVKELNLLKSCPECFRERMPFMIKVIIEQSKQNYGKANVLDKSWNLPYEEKSVDDMWMTKLCNLVHPLVWVRLHSYPIWPGKLISLDEESALVLFFGDYDLNIVPIGSICVHTQSNHKRLISNISNFASRRPATSIVVTNSFSKEYQLALEELNIHLDSIKTKFEYFAIPNKKIEFNIQKGVEYYERLRCKLSKDPDVIVSSSIDDAHSREDCVSEVANCDKFELRCDTERFDKIDSISSASLTSAYHNSAVKQGRDSLPGPPFIQYFEHGVQNLMNKLKRECLTYFKTPNREDCIEDWQSCKPVSDSHYQNSHQQTDSISVKHAAVQFSSKQFEKDEEMNVYVKYLEQCLATSEIELRRQEILSSIRHEEYIMEFNKQHKEMKKLYDTDVLDIVKTIRTKVDDKFTRSLRVLKTNEWCAFCGKLARFYCCWNTCYCNQECQTKHWDLHKTACSQVNRAPPTVLRSNASLNNATILNNNATNGMQNLIPRNGDSVVVNGTNAVEFVPNMHPKQRFQLKR